MLFVKSSRIRGKAIGFFILSIFFINGCATQHEAVNLEPHVNKMVLRVNELGNRQYELESRLKKLEEEKSQIPHYMRQLADLEAGLTQMEEQLQTHLAAEEEKGEWRNFEQRLEDLSRELEQDRKDWQAFQAEMKMKFEAGASQSTAQELPPSVLPNGSNGEIVSAEESSSPNLSDEKAAYEDAYQSYLDEDYEKTRQKFQHFLTLFPKSDLADNAQFWIGESFYNQKNYEQAILEYEKVVQGFSKGDKMIAALLKQGFAFHSLGQNKEAQILLEQVIRKAPESEQAQIAKKKLETLKRPTKRPSKK